MQLSRHRFLTGLAAVTGAVTLAPAEAVMARRSRTIVKKATAARTGEYIYLTFRVPRGVNRVAVALTKDNPETKVGVGLFDWRGAEYRSPGFRGQPRRDRAPLLLAGAGVRRGVPPEDAGLTDVAPTIAHLLGVRPPADAQGRALTESLGTPGPGGR